MEKIDRIVKYPYLDSYWPLWCSWRRTSFQMLSIAESKLFNYVKNQCKVFFVPIGNNAHYLRTLIASKYSQSDSVDQYDDKVPIVFLHGMGSGIGLWCKNIDPISDCRKLYAMDLLGFGFSSRPSFPANPVEVEDYFTESIEQWRKSLGLDSFILLGHSFGGYLACSYAIKYPHNVRHLILADPWGFPKYNPDILSKLRRSLFKRSMFSIVNTFNPLALIRFAGPLGPYLIEKFRPDLGFYFQGDKNSSEFSTDSSVEPKEVFDYIYHCNAQYPSGEMAFKSLSFLIGWAYNPMVERADKLDNNVPVSFIYGENSWMDRTAGLQFSEKRPDAYVDIQVIPKCGHHIYAENSDDFNEKINEICLKVDSAKDDSSEKIANHLSNN